MAGRRAVRRQAIVLGRTKLGEQDLILTMLSREGEQIRAVAKGARKPGSRLAARTEVCCEIDFLVTQGRGLGIVTEAQIVDAHEGVRPDLEALSCASALCELARVTSYEDVDDPFLCAILSRALTACEEATDRGHLDLVYAAYAIKVLSHSGWRPVVDECVACGEPTHARFSVRAGGVLCESCARGVEGAVSVTENQMAWLDALVGSTFTDLMKAEVDAATAGFLLGLAHGWATTHLDTRLRAAEFYRGV